MAQNLEKKTVTISIHRPTDTPTIHVAGTFSDPKWELLKLVAKPLAADDDADKAQSEGYIFSRAVEVPEGKYEYRFREGSEGQWFHDDNVANSKFSPALVQHVDFALYDSTSWHGVPFLT